MEGISNYQLAPGVRVRKEKFGLLFYNSKDTNLTFVKSGDLLDIKKTGADHILSVNDTTASDNVKLIQCIKLLQKKRLIREA